MLRRLLENDLAPCPRRYLCHEKLEISTEQCCLRNPSISLTVVAAFRRLLTVAELHGLLPNTQVVPSHHSISACRQQTIGIMVHSLQAGYAVMHILQDSTGDFSQGLGINKTEGVVG